MALHYRMLTRGYVFVAVQPRATVGYMEAEDYRIQKLSVDAEWRLYRKLRWSHPVMKPRRNQGQGLWWNQILQRMGTLVAVRDEVEVIYSCADGYCWDGGRFIEIQVTLRSKARPALNGSKG